MSQKHVRKHVVRTHFLSLLGKGGGEGKKKQENLTKCMCGQFLVIFLL
jgi:hypothetical protein